MKMNVKKSWNIIQHMFSLKYVLRTDYELI